MEQQTQNQPDFNFILNQPHAGGEPPKRRSPLVIVAIAAIIVGFVVLLLLIFFFPKKSVVDAPAPSKDAATAPAVADVTEAYFSALNDQEYAKAYELLADSTRQEYTQTEYIEITPVVYNNIKLDTCKKESETGSFEKGNRTMVYVCQTYKGATNAQISLFLLEESGQARIQAIRITSRDKA